MTKIELAKFTANEHGNRDLDQAVAELSREIDVRRRMYDKWVSEGKFAYCDGVDRMARILTALRFLITLQEHGVTNTGDLAGMPAIG
jgi:hypothetical protein